MRNRIRWTAWRNRRGQALIEFALIAPILLLLVIGLIEFARAFNLQQTVTDAAREGARLYAVIDPDVDQAFIQNAINTKLQLAGVRATPTIVYFANGVQGSWVNDRGAIIAVQVSIPYTFTFLSRLRAAGWAPGGNLTLTSTARMRHE